MFSFCVRHRRVGLHCAEPILSVRSRAESTLAAQAYRGLSAVMNPLPCMLPLAECTWKNVGEPSLPLAFLTP